MDIFCYQTRCVILCKYCITNDFVSLYMMLFMYGIIWYCSRNCRLVDGIIRKQIDVTYNANVQYMLYLLYLLNWVQHCCSSTRGCWELDTKISTVFALRYPPKCCVFCLHKLVVIFTSWWYFLKQFSQRPNHYNFWLSCE